MSRIQGEAVEPTGPERQDPEDVVDLDPSGRAVPDPWGTAVTVAVAVGIAVVGRWVIRRR